LKKIIQHSATRAQNPLIIVITPPPINEYQLEGFDKEMGTPHPSRTASLAKTYSEIAREVAASLNVPAADIWTALMATTGWKEGQPLAGSRDLPNNEKFCSLFTDGTCKRFHSPMLLQLY
jgi:lysophospholipase L1-like esterase